MLGFVAVERCGIEEGGGGFLGRAVIASLFNKELILAAEGSFLDNPFNFLFRLVIFPNNRGRLWFVDRLR